MTPRDLLTDLLHTAAFLVLVVAGALIGGTVMLAGWIEEGQR